MAQPPLPPEVVQPFPLQGSSGLGRGSLLPFSNSLIQRLALVLLHGDPAKHGKDSFLLPRFCYHSQRLLRYPQAFTLTESCSPALALRHIVTMA